MDEENDKLTSARHLVYFAAERTIFSWMRTALGLMGLGFVIDRIGILLQQTNGPAGASPLPRGFSFWAGTSLVLLGVAMTIVAAFRYGWFVRRYRERGDTEPGAGLSMAIVFTILIALAGSLIAGAMLLLAR